MGYGLKIGLLVVLALPLGHPADAVPCPPGNPPTNCAPPPGAILDLSGTAISHPYRQYTTSFTATDATTNVSFSFRDDPAFLGLDDVSVSTGGGGNLLLNPGFELGIVDQHAPVGWTYLNAFGADASGVVSSVTVPPNTGPHSGTNYYSDGAVQAYDGITQAVATTSGSNYTISFWLAEGSVLPTFSRLSTNGNSVDNGGDGIDLLVFAGAVPALAVPEPASLALLGVGLAGLGLVRRRKVG